MPVTDGQHAAMAWRRSNLGYLFFAASDALIRARLRIVHAAGFPLLTDAQVALFGNLDAAGTRLTELAMRSGVAKQSMIEIVDRAERSGLVERRSDPDDRRAKLVVATRSGGEIASVARRAFQQAEDEFSAVMGDDDVALIRKTLTFYARSPVGADLTPTFQALLTASDHRFVSTVLAAVHARAHADVTQALLALFRNLELDGARLTDVAAVARVTKQSMRALVDRAEALGLVERTPGTTDLRAKTIRFSDAGLAMLEHMRCGVEKAESDFARGHGDDCLERLKRALTRFVSVHSANATLASRSTSIIRA